MPRYFIEVAYSGARYSGFQVQHNANTIQAEVERALKIFYKNKIALTGSSRTDAGVHALQNFFHFDFDQPFKKTALYNLNSLLNQDIVIRNVFEVQPNAHCRFDAASRTYIYHIHKHKNPFLYGTSYYYPFSLNIDLLQQYAALLLQFTDFTAFSKRNTQVNHFICNIQQSQWKFEQEILRYEITADRFLRGMIKAIVGTMLRLSKNNMLPFELKRIIGSKDCTQADFSPPSHGLFLKEVTFKPEIFLTH